MSDYLIHRIAADPVIDVRTHVEVVGATGSGQLRGVSIRDRRTHDVSLEDADALFILIGATPHTGWLPPEIGRDEWGFVVTGPDLLEVPGGADGWPLERPPLLLETSVPGVFAAGDVRHRSVKRVASAVGEGATAITLVHRYLADEG